MNIMSRLRSKAAGFLGNLLYTSLLVCGTGVISAPAHAATVTVDQSPLIIQRSLPPNIVLMLDDSGSMAWDYMPDKGYLTSTTSDGYRNSANNGTYYNPSVTYTPPPKANGTDSYPASPGLDKAYNDGFRDTSAVDVRSYNGGSYDYFTALSRETSATYTATCDIGYTLTNKSGTWWCTRTSRSDRTPICSSGDSLSSDQGTCTTTTIKLFTYTTGPAAGPYTRHYVGVTGDCAKVAAASLTNCDDSSATQQNVANWFSYYRTRMLMAKSGLMNSFATLDPTFRVGFGSINGNNNSGLPSDISTYNSREIANVAPFGNEYPAAQKNKFWSWLNDIRPNNGTPLRLSLDAVGQYYESAQPWNGMESDPDYTTAAASTQLACRQSYTILTTDGFWNGDTPSNIGDTDGTAGPTVTGPNNQSLSYVPVLPYADGTSTTSTDTKTAQCSRNYALKSPDSTHSTYYCYRSSNQSVLPPSCSSGYTLSNDQGTCTRTTTTSNTYSDTLADVAMKYWKADLQSGMSNEVPTNADDPAYWQHMATFTLGLGFSPLYSDQSTPIPMDQVFAWANGDASKAISGFTWPKPSSDNLNNIADLAHAAVNGHGGFFSAKSPDEFANGLKEALKRAAERVGTGASLAANSTQLQTGTVAYQANYWTAKWKGDLKALAVDSASGAIAINPTWTASGKLPATAIDTRNIKTYNPTAAAGSQFVAFKVATDGTLPSLSTAQHAALSSVAGTATNETDLINYLRGDASKEQNNSGSYRNRDTPVGDIVNSQPVYVGAPNGNQFYTEAFTGSTVFAQYASNQAGRNGIVYVAANDGMLHGFAADSGTETFAYLPGAVITAGVSALASLDYGGTVAHGFFNDGELTVADAYIGSPAGWKTVLVGTTGRGVAKAVYALDITDPANVKFLWERSAADGNTADGNSGYIGQMTGKPVIAQTADGTWSVLIGNGYNSTAGVAALLQFNLADGTLHVHKTTDTSGLAAPAVWMDPSGNGVSTAAYAGDANGNVWSFALNTSVGTTATATPDSDGVKLFTAVDAGGNVQPITAGMLAGKDPNTGNTWVFFGTGRYLTTTDLADLNTQSWYGLIVQSGTSGLAVTSASTRTANLVQRSITAEAGNGRTVTTLAQAAADSASIAGKSGWYIDLTSPVNGAEGERMVTPNQFQGNLLLGTTRIPKASDPCNPSGQGWIMALDPFTGTNPSADFFDINGDGKIDSSDEVNGTPAAGIGFTSLPNNPIFVGSTMLTSFDNGTTSSIKTSSSTGSIERVSWRELINQ